MSSTSSNVNISTVESKRIMIQQRICSILEAANDSNENIPLSKYHYEIEVNGSSDVNNTSSRHK